MKKEKEHLPVIGVGSVYVVVIMVITVAGISFSANKGFGGRILGTPHTVLAGVGAAMIV